jgi:hypothetical protein
VKGSWLTIPMPSRLVVAATPSNPSSLHVSQLVVPLLDLARAAI